MSVALKAVAWVWRFTKTVKRLPGTLETGESQLPGTLDTWESRLPGVQVPFVSLGKGDGGLSYTREFSILINISMNFQSNSI